MGVGVLKHHHQVTRAWTILIILCLGEHVSGNLYKFGAKQNRRTMTGTGERVKRGLSHVLADALTGKPGEGYYMEIEIGTPKQKLNVLIDTGSSNFAVACDSNLNVKTYFKRDETLSIRFRESQWYMFIVIFCILIFAVACDSNLNEKTYFKRDESSTYEDRDTPLFVPYTQGSWRGRLGKDLVSFPSLGNVSVVANIACIVQEDQFFINNSNWHGILGLGYPAIARPDSSVEPVFDAMVRQHQVDNLFSVELCGAGPNDGNKMVSGSVLYGGSDPSKYTGALFGTPILQERYYEVAITDIQVAGHSLNMDCKEYNMKQTIVDTGTTNMRLPNRVFDSLVAKMKANLNYTAGFGHVVDGFWEGQEFQCYRFGYVPYDDFPTLTITLPMDHPQSLNLEVSAQQYLRPVSDSEAVIAPGDACFKFGISRIAEGTVIGAIMMEGYYVIFDRAEKQMKFGKTTCPPVDTNSRQSTVTQGPRQGPLANYYDCVYREPVAGTSDWDHRMIVVYVFAVIAVISLIPVIIIIYRQCRSRDCKSVSRSRTESETAVTESEIFVDTDT